MANDLAVVSAPAQQQIVTTPSVPLAERMFPTMKPKSVAAIDQNAITAQDASDYAETMTRLGPPATRDAVIADAQRLMATHGTEALRKVVAERGMGSNVHVMDLAARVQRLLDAKDREIAALKGARK